MLKNSYLIGKVQELYQKWKKFHEADHFTKEQIMYLKANILREKKAKHSCIKQMEKINANSLIKRKTMTLKVIIKKSFNTLSILHSTILG